MNKKVIARIMIILFMAICIFIIMPQNVTLADDSSSSSVSSTVGGISPSSVSAPKGITDAIAGVLGFLRVASGLAAVVVIAFTGFEYIIAENPDMKKELKNKMLPVIVGLVCVFSAVSLATFILAAVE